MPSDGNSSPAFQAVRPATVPPLSFCQIFLPILAFWFALNPSAAGAAGAPPDDAHAASPNTNANHGMFRIKRTLRSRLRIPSMERRPPGRHLQVALGKRCRLRPLLRQYCGGRINSSPGCGSNGPNPGIGLAMPPSPEISVTLKVPGMPVLRRTPKIVPG